VSASHGDFPAEHLVQEIALSAQGRGANFCTRVVEAILPVELETALVVGMCELVHKCVLEAGALQNLVFAQQYLGIVRTWSLLLLVLRVHRKAARNRLVRWALTTGQKIRGQRTSELLDAVYQPHDLLVAPKGQLQKRGTFRVFFRLRRLTCRLGLHGASEDRAESFWWWWKKWGQIVANLGHQGNIGQI
jgi:hypothetical protein